MRDLLEKFVPIEVGIEETRIADKHRPTLKKLLEAAKLIDTLFFLQADERNPAWRKQIANDPALADTLAAFDVMYGPWNRLEHNRAFWGDTERPKGVTFYPRDMTQDEFNAWLAVHPEDREAFTGYFTVIRRDGDKLVAVPYSEAYAEQLQPAARLLDEAADLAVDPRFATYLRSRADAFRSNQYTQSDMDWMDLGDGDIEAVIGPYEVYDDELFGYKAAYQSYITLRDPVSSAKLEAIKSFIPEMEAYLPIDDRYRNAHRGMDSPISVVDLLTNSGYGKVAVQALAFNLPNDEVVREQKGSKKVMLKNVAEAKYEKILVPIAQRLIRADQVPNVSFDAFFNHTLVHETAHGLGPGKITVERDGKKITTSVNEELKELYVAIEEAKADTLGLYLNYLLVEKGMHPPEFMENVYASFLGGFFRSVRFGANSAHGKANMIQFNYLVEKGAVVRDSDGRYGYVSDKMFEAVKSLAHDILMIQAHGDYAAASAFVGKYGQMGTELQSALEMLADVPTDIRPSYPVEEQMRSW
jgi:hypothetical protein